MCNLVHTLSSICYTRKKTILEERSKNRYRQYYQNSTTVFYSPSCERVFCRDLVILITGFEENVNHSNKRFTHERNEPREFIGSRKNMYVICGDRHWEYVSVYPKTGVREYSCGPSSDIHAGGYNMSMRTPMHKDLRIKGGFLAVSVKRIDGKSTITFRHYGQDDKIYNEDR